jgi:hypothetical protein
MESKTALAAAWTHAGGHDDSASDLRNDACRQQHDRDESVGIVLAYIHCTEIRERHMELVLTDDEAETLSGILSDALLD